MDEKWEEFLELREQMRDEVRAVAVSRGEAAAKELYDRWIEKLTALKKDLPPKMMPRVKTEDLPTSYLKVKRSATRH